jgi:pyruvate ferredoxin oxidoreductase gamma subunit
VYAIRIHGRGGQGVVTAAELLSLAGFAGNRHAQAFPSFGSERTGAPIVSYCRLDDRHIRIREPIIEADAVIVQDPTLLGQANVFEGLSHEGLVLVNSPKSGRELGLPRLSGAKRCVTVPASDIAETYLGRQLPNVPLLGAFAALSGQVSIEAVEQAVRERFPGEVGEKNARAARAGHDWVKAHGMEEALAKTA